MTLSATWLGFAVLCFPQTATVVPRNSATDVATAAKSPETLARFVESHRSIDWKALGMRSGLRSLHIGSHRAEATSSPQRHRARPKP